MNKRITGHRKTYWQVCKHLFTEGEDAANNLCGGCAPRILFGFFGVLALLLSAYVYSWVCVCAALVSLSFAPSDVMFSVAVLVSLVAVPWILGMIFETLRLFLFEMDLD